MDLLREFDIKHELSFDGLEQEQVGNILGPVDSCPRPMGSPIWNQSLLRDKKSELHLSVY